MNAPDGKTKEFNVSNAAAWYILIICTLLYMVNFMDRQVFSASTELMKKDLGLLDTHIGTMQMLFLLGIAFFSFPAAYLVDRWSRSKTLALMAFLWSIFTFLTGLGSSVTGVTIPRFLVGVGEAGFAAGSTALIAAVFTMEKRSRIMGLFNMAVPLGVGLGTIIGGALAKAYGWRVPFFIFAVPGIILAILALYMKDYPTEKSAAGNRGVGFFQAAKSLFKIPTLRWIYLGFGMVNILVFSFFFWGPPFVARVQNVDAAKAGAIVGGISLLSIIGSGAGGFLADFWQKYSLRGRPLAAALGAMILTLLYACSVWFDFAGIGLVFGVLFGIVLVLPLPAISAITQDVTPMSLRGVAWGMCMFCMYFLGGAWAPKIVGAISDSLGGGAHGLKTGLMYSLAGGVMAALCFWRASRTYDADRKNAHMLLEKQDKPFKNIA